MESLRFIEVLLPASACHKLAKNYPMFEFPDPARLSIEEGEEVLRRYRALRRMDKRVIFVGERKGGESLIKDTFPCPWCRREEFEEYMTRLDVLERSGEITIERTEEAELSMVAG